MPYPAALSRVRQQEAGRLYQSGLSAQQIADKLGVNLNATFYALRKQNIKRRSAKETNRLRFEAKPLSYQTKTRLTREEESLKQAAVMLYWAEGYKVSKSTIDFANSDPKMALIFMRFLTGICRVDKTRIRGHLYCYEGQDVAALTEYWSNLLSLPRGQFIKPYIKQAAPGPRGPRMLHGLVHIVYCDKKLLLQLLTWIDEYAQGLTK